MHASVSMTKLANDMLKKSKVVREGVVAHWRLENLLNPLLQVIIVLSHLIFTGFTEFVCVYSFKTSCHQDNHLLLLLTVMTGDYI